MQPSPSKSVSLDASGSHNISHSKLLRVIFSIFTVNILVNTSTRFSQSADGQVWAPTESFAYAYWTRYLDVFDRVDVLARVLPVAGAPKDARLVSGPGVKILALPDFVGVRHFAREYFRLRRQIARYVAEANAIGVVLPCVVGDLAWRSIPFGRPYAAMVSGDPYEVFAPNTSDHLLRPLLRWWFSHRLRAQCRQACACAYVTQHILPQRYPSGDGQFSTYYSNTNLSHESILTRARGIATQPKPFRLITVGTFDTLYKGQDTLLEAVRLCRQRNFPVDLVLVGDGRRRGEIELLAQRLGVAQYTHFAGQLRSTAAVREELDKADLFVLPSRTEGLPKSVLEAMARALPCIGTSVGGIPELLPAEDMVPPDAPELLAQRIEEVLQSPGRMEMMSSRNLETSRQYRPEVLRERRIAFYSVLRDRSADWLSGRRVNSPLVADCPS